LRIIFVLFLAKALYRTMCAHFGLSGLKARISISDKQRSGDSRKSLIKSVIYYELLEPNKTVTTDLYQRRLNRFSQELEQKHLYTGKEERSMKLLRDNAKSHIAFGLTKTKDIINLGWKVL
jgi:hypothetical protein